MRRRVGRRQKVGNDWLRYKTSCGVFPRKQKPKQDEYARNLLGKMPMREKWEGS